MTPERLAEIRAKLDTLTESAYDGGVAVGLARTLLDERDALCAANTKLETMLCTVRDHAFLGDAELLAGTVEQIDALLAELRSATRTPEAA